MNVHQPTFATIGIVAKRDDPRLAPTLATLLDHLRKRDRRILADAKSCRGVGLSVGLSHSELVPREALAAACDLGIAVGGDGTLLAAARVFAPAGVPLLGINLGRLGFLADISPAQMTGRLDAILAGCYRTEPRAMLAAAVAPPGQPPTGVLSAFNDVVLRVRDEVRMIEFETFIDDCYVNTQRADGLVISTPTGSTAYALSGGGPILHPRLTGLVLVPICPHTLSHRPLVVPADSHIEVILRAGNRCPATVSCDGQNTIEIAAGDRLLIDRHPADLHLIHPRDYDYFHILRAKLRWSEQP